jgi:hypothetical protein
MHTVQALKLTSGGRRRTPLDTERMKVPVARRALIARIRRDLERRGEGQDLKVARAELRKTVGEYFVAQKGRRDLVEDHVNLEELGRRLGVLQTWEYLQK